MCDVCATMFCFNVLHNVRLALVFGASILTTFFSTLLVAHIYTVIKKFNYFFVIFCVVTTESTDRDGISRF